MKLLLLALVLIPCLSHAGEFDLDDSIDTDTDRTIASEAVEESPETSWNKYIDGTVTRVSTEKVQYTKYCQSTNSTPASQKDCVVAIESEITDYKRPASQATKYSSDHKKINGKKTYLWNYVEYSLKESDKAKAKKEDAFNQENGY